ncbi:hypothetical protein ACQCRW_26170, partial [Ralstonia pseudosolanacearum]
MHEPPHGEEADLRQLKVEKRSAGDEKSDHGDNLNSVNVAGETSQQNPKQRNILVSSTKCNTLNRVRCCDEEVQASER